ncbi:MAG: polysaccharide pyruvyl transferase family protein [Terrimicrobiaceae bacterium]|nr:polysaccharide pyruvyl transferase family protein [Terrimicrobiaceae bacterium]
MSRTGVLTFHRCINYGTYWQARCLLEGLAKRGATADLLDHRSARVDASEWTCALNPVRPRRIRPSEIAGYGLKLQRTARALGRLPRSARFDLDRPGEAPRRRTVVVGSDEVWNPDHPWYGGCAAFFGEGLVAERLVSFAASCGNYDGPPLNGSHAARLARFGALSVRDEATARAVGGAVPIVLDPCLQFPPVIPKGSLSRRIAVYGHSFSVEMGRAVRAWAESAGAEVVAIGYGVPWAHRSWIAAGPLEFPEFVSRSLAVVTNFFHGCVFSILTGKPFAAELSPYRSQKVRFLLGQFGLSDRAVSFGTPTNLAPLFSRPLAVDEPLRLWRERTESFLEHAGLVAS